MSTLCLAFAACNSGGSPSEPITGGGVGTCGPYPDWQTSPYVLPYPAGAEAVISQGNCSPGSHNGPARHAYDFALPLGSTVIASRSGEVVFVVDDRPDSADPQTGDNVIIILHDDGTRAFYSHLAQGSSRAAAGERIDQGQAIAQSGNSGSTGGLPHLHFQVTPCPNREMCGTLPTTFSNTVPNPQGLIAGTVYPAK